jgi:hypothetical protein
VIFKGKGEENAYNFTTSQYYPGGKPGNASESEFDSTSQKIKATAYK